jgi:hypothetical protein
MSLLCLIPLTLKILRLCLHIIVLYLKLNFSIFIKKKKIKNKKFLRWMTNWPVAPFGWETYCAFESRLPCAPYKKKVFKLNNKFKWFKTSSLNFI